MKRRDFLETTIGGLVLAGCAGEDSNESASDAASAPAGSVFHVKGVPDNPFDASHPNRHVGVETLIDLMGRSGLRLYRSTKGGALSGSGGMIAPDDVVLVKVNAQWKYRGCTNSDVVRGLIERLLEHPDGFRGEIVIVENGQGRGSLACDTSSSYDGDRSVHANANDESHTFLYLVDSIFRDARVSAYLLDPIRSRFIGADDHTTDGYRRFEDVSYPCFTTRGGRRVELREGVWSGSAHEPRLKLINVPVLKHHDTGGSEITASIKHFYGLLSMQDGNSSARHYDRLGEACGKMIAAVRAPALSIIDAIWVSHGALKGWPASKTYRANQLLASQDPVALDYWAAKSVLYPIDNNARHAPDFAGVDRWLTQAQDLINGLGGLHDGSAGLVVPRVTKLESEIKVMTAMV